MGLKKPVDEAIEKWPLHAEIQYHIMPMPSTTSSAQTPKATPTAAAPKGVVKDYDAKIQKAKAKASTKAKSQSLRTVKSSLASTRGPYA